MIMSRSSLANYTSNNPYHQNGRDGLKPTKIVVHHVAGVMGVAQIDKALRSHGVSTHYGVSEGNIGSYVDENHAAWACGSHYYNVRTINIEVSNDRGAPSWHVSDKSIQTTIRLVADIAKRMGLKSVKYTGNASGTLICHKFVAATACPGPYLFNKMKYIEAEVNKILKGETGAMQASFNGTDAQLWQIIDTGDGFVKIRNKSGKVLDVKGGSLEPMKNGRIVQAYKDNGTPAQRWKMERVSINGEAVAYRFRSALDQEYCLDVSGGALGTRAKLQLYKVQGAKANQYAQAFYVMDTYHGGDYAALVCAKSFFVVDSNPTGIAL